VRAAAVANLLGLSLVQFEAQLPSLIERGFPQSDATTGLYCIEAVDRWRLRRHKVVKNYFEAVKRWIPDAWKSPKEFVVLRGAGLWGICFIGAEVIDRTLRDGSFKTESMIKVLRSGKV
jgi:hypothetical protein